MAGILVERADRFALVTLNRPDARNALNRELLTVLPSTLGELDDDDDVDVIVLTGAGASFCAGLDLRELGPGGELDIPALTHAGSPWPMLTKPLIGAVNGHAITGGLELALRCDVLLASPNAVFGDTHARLGILPFWGLTTSLPAAIGLRNALRMSLTGDFVSADEAYRLGLVAAVVPAVTLVDEACHLATSVASSDQRAVRRLLDTYRAVALADAADALALEHSRAVAWQGTVGDAAEIARHRDIVMARGRGQASGRST